MSLPITFHRAASAEFIKASAWYETKRVGLALEFIAEVGPLVDAWHSPMSKHVYHRLVIAASSPSTEIWLGDDAGHLVQKEIGELTTSLLPGNYVVEFGLGNPTYPIPLAKASQYIQSELEAGPHGARISSIAICATPRTHSFPLAGGRLGWGLTRRRYNISTPSLALPLQGGGDCED